MTEQKASATEMSREQMIAELIWNHGGNGWGVCSSGSMLAAAMMSHKSHTLKSPVLIGADVPAENFTDEDLRGLVEISRERAANHIRVCGDIRESDNLMTIRKLADGWSWSRRSWECGPLRLKTLSELHESMKGN